jgi:hypothetical protein
VFSLLVDLMCARCVTIFCSPQLVLFMLCVYLPTLYIYRKIDFMVPIVLESMVANYKFIVEKYAFKQYI